MIFNEYITVYKERPPASPRPRPSNDNDGEDQGAGHGGISA